MHIDENQSVYRIHRFYRKDEKPKKYRGSYEVTDEHTGRVMASGDLVGQAVFATHALLDQDRQAWQMTPNRKIMPSRWIVTDPGGKAVLQFDQKILGKMVNPLYRVVLAVLDGEGREIYRLVDPRASIPDRLLGVNIGEWAIMAGERPVAKLAWLPREKAPPKGLFKALKKFFTSSDRAVICAGNRHVLPAPAVLGMLWLFDQLTDISGA